MKKIFCYITIAFLMCAAGCGSLFPSEKRIVKSPWGNFKEVKAAFDQIIPNQTTTEDLVRLNFDPFTTANITILTYLEIMQRFMPNSSISKTDLDPQIQACLEVRDSCRAYEMKQQYINHERFGNIALDILHFRRRTQKSGWESDVLIVMKNDLVVYKLWSGKPNVDETIDTRNPLGPLQDLGFWNRLILP